MKIAAHIALKRFNLGKFTYAIPVDVLKFFGKVNCKYEHC